MKAFPAAVAAILCSCAPPDETGETAATGGRGVLLFTLDTTRADRIGAYGHTSGDTSTIDRLAREGVVFEEALTTAPITLPAHASILTGVYPSAHGLRDNGIFSLSSRGTLLAEILRDEGFRTGAFVGSFVLDRRHGLDQGFEVYDGPARDASTITGERPAEEVTDRTLAWLDGLGPDEDWFAWVHYYDPHLPRAAPGIYEIEHPDPYDAEIAYCDDQIARVLDHVAAAGLDEALTVIVTSDHGEDLDDHGEANHGVFLYQSTMRVPLVLHGEGVAAGERSDARVSLTRLPATVLALLGIPASRMPDAQGPSLVGEDGRPAGVGPAELADGALYLETLLPYYSHRWHPYVGLVSQGHKLIRGKGLELYDLGADPGETRDLAEERAELAARLAGELQRLRARHGDLSWAREEELGEDDVEALAALGYTGGSAGGDPFDAALPDPRERVAGHKEWGRAQVLMMRANEASAAGDPAGLERGRELLLQAEAILEKEHSSYAGDPAVVLSLGQVKQALGDFEGALPYFERSLQEDPSSGATFYGLAVCLLQTGRKEEALRAGRRSVELSPELPQAYMLLAFHHRESGEYGKAAWWLKSLAARLEPGDPTRAQVEHDLRLLEERMEAAGQALEPPR